MVSTYFWRAQYVGGGVVEEQCVCVKLCIKAAPAPLIKIYVHLDLLCGTWESFSCYFEHGPKTAEII